MADTQQFFKEQSFINGEWVKADSGKTFAVDNPADGKIVANVADMGAPETTRAVEAAYAAFPAWKKMLAKDRAKILRKWSDLIVANADALAALLTMEQGKPLAEAKGEIINGAGFIEWYADEGRRVYGDTIPPMKDSARIIITKEPIGVVGAITPWNFPSSMITRKLGPALGAGCTAVLKPAAETPLSALALAVLAEQAGMPKGVFNIVTGKDAAAIGQVLTTHPHVKKISFTGSTEVGKVLLAQAASTVKKSSMELGGNAPFIVFNSADLDKAVEGAVASKYRNAGQTCICANRIYVQDGIFEEFTRRLTEKVKAMKIGPGNEAGVSIGPLINQKGFDKARRHIDDAVAKGAALVYGGGQNAAGGLFMTPAILTGMTPDMMMTQEETFGPVAGLYRFADEAEVIALANDTRFGLASYFYTNELGQAFRVAEALEYGMVAVNESLLSYEAAPFGGVKESGLGREGSKYGLEDYLSIKYTLVGGI
ncbi:MAG: succinate-semialdehyde dehydrogenase [Micavibrio sp.]|nr:succinate-semialdehyde dehydrogenase [Micavibrio sp.]